MGVGVFRWHVHNVIEYKFRTALSIPKLEFSSFETKIPRGKPFLLSNLYRSQNTPIEQFDKLETLLRIIEAENIESNIKGDLYCNVLAITPSNKTRHLIELCESFQYTQTIRILLLSVIPISKSLIDLFLTNEPDKFTSTVVSHLGCSDDYDSLIYASSKQISRKPLLRIIYSRQYIENNTWARGDMEFIIECYINKNQPFHKPKPCHIVENQINVFHCLRYSSENSEL